MFKMIDLSRPLIIAHRGDSAHAPENTLAAFQMAIDAGAEGVEFDVRLAADGVPVVIHDHNLLRTGSLSAKISQMSSQELSQADVGSWFNRAFPRRARREFAKETVPILKDVLEFLRDFRGLIYVELKAGEMNFQELSAAVCDCVRDSPQLSQMIVASFKVGAITMVRHQLPKVQTAALFAPEIMTYLRRREHIITLAREFGAHQISVHYTLVTPTLARLAADAGMPLTVWTVDDPKWLARRKDLHIKTLITNDPKSFLRNV